MLAKGSAGVAAWPPRALISQNDGGTRAGAQLTRKLGGGGSPKSSQAAAGEMRNENHEVGDARGWVDGRGRECVVCV